MSAQFWDQEDLANPRNGAHLADAGELRAELARLRGREPFFAELIADNGFKLLLGLGPEECCAQYSAADGSPPYLMALSSNETDQGEVEFLIGNTPTPVPKRYCLTRVVMEGIAAEFVETGRTQAGVIWEAI